MRLLGTKTEHETKAQQDGGRLRFTALWTETYFTFYLQCAKAAAKSQHVIMQRPCVF